MKKISWFVIYLLLLMPHHILYGPTAQDKAIAEKIFQQVNKEKSPYSQSDAHMSLNKIQKKILKKVSDLAKNKTLLEKALTKERALQKDYWVFYTAVPAFHLLQDITKKLYEAKIDKPINSFKFIRYDFKNKVYNKYKDITDFLISEINNTGIINDREMDLRTILVSTNLALFGNVGFTGESTWYFFNELQPWVNNEGFVETKQKLLASTLQSFGYSTDYVKELLSLEDYLKGSDGLLESDLFQIFVPKNMVDKIGYKSWRMGIPFDEEFIKKLFNRKKMTFGDKDLIPYGTPEQKQCEVEGVQCLNPMVYSFMEQWKDKDPKVVPTVKALLNNVKAGKFKLSPFLKKYTTDPKSIPSINWIQARLLITNDMLLNPNSGIKIFRYNRLDPKKKELYKKKLKAIIEKITGKRIRTDENSSVANKFFEQADRAEGKGEYLTQSQAHMSLPAIQEKIVKLPKIAENKEIIAKALENEKKYNQNYSVFYHSVPPGARVFQDVMRELYRRIVGNVGSLKDNAFQFIRYVYQDPTYNTYKSVGNFMTTEITKNGIVDDNLLSVKTNLLSVNLAFFGNAGYWGECTYKYFVTPQTWPNIKRSWLEDCLKSFGFSTQYVDDLIKLQNTIKTENGDLFQIFIPNDKLNNVGYLSWRQGIPFDYSFIKNNFADPKELYERKVQLTSDQVNKRLDVIKKGWQNKDSEIVNIVKQLLANIKSGVYNLFPFLTVKYRKKPQPLYDYYQARLLITNDILLNPKSDVKIFRFSKLTKQQEQTYQSKLNNIINKIMQEKRQQQSKKITELENAFKGLVGSLKKLNVVLKGARAAA